MPSPRPNNAADDLSNLKRKGLVAPYPSLVRALHGLVFQTLVRLRWGALHRPSTRESTAIDHFRARLVDPAQPVQGEDVTGEWASITDRIADLALTEDPRGFFGWDVIQRCVAPALNPSALYLLRALKRRPDFRSEWRPFLTTARAGRPAPFPLAPRTTAGRIAHLHHLAVLQDHAGRSIEEFDVVVEFGGGFGGMELLARERGFTGTYVIIDLPVMRALQAFYLSLTRPVPITEDVAESLDGGALTLLISLEQLADLDPLLVGAEHSLFLATWSLSESPIPVRSQVYERLPEFSHVLVAYQRSFAGIVNATLPVELAERADPALEWNDLPIVRSRADRVDPESHYAIGRQARA